MRREGNGIRFNGEFGGIEDEELGVGDDVDGNLNGAGEFKCGEIGLEFEIVAFGYSEFGEPRLTPELGVF